MSEFLRKYEASMAKFTDACPYYHTASAYAVTGALLSRVKYRCVLEGGVPPLWTNLWVLLVGDSGSFKSTAARMAQDVMMEVEPELLGPHDGSPEGFLADLVKKERLLKGNAATVLIQPEFSTTLAQFQRSYSTSMKPLLMDFYDVPNVFKKVLAKSEFVIPKPRVSMLGAIAIELLPAYTEQEDWLGGFFSRTLLISGKPTNNLLRAGSPSDAVVAGHASALRNVLKVWRNTQFKRGRPRFDYDVAGAKAARQLPDAPEEPNLKLSLTRAGVHLMKCAAIEQIDEDPEAKAIGKAAVERALGLIMHWWQTVPEIIDECYARGRGEFEGDRMHKRIHRYLLKQQDSNGGHAVPWTEVMQNCALHKRYMNEAIDSLRDAGLVESGVDEETQAAWLLAKRPERKDLAKFKTAQAKEK